MAGVQNYKMRKKKNEKSERKIDLADTILISADYFMEWF